MLNLSDSSNIGKEYKGFVLVSVEDLPDYKAKGIYLRHKRTGLEVYHVLKDDKENLFAYAFRTVAKDSKGTAHIMEHSTLCGSEKYPLKEPFATLAAQSINTFLNALTYPDKTVYPGASTVKSDYFNMLDVYGDCVFFPKLDYTTFIQEGHRLEMDENGKLSVQGVVYNEMKGNYSAYSQVAFSELVNYMYPNSYPSFDSGGDPLVIPELTYEQFLEFHQKFYSPNNCLLFLYGDIPTAEQLDFINERFIERIEKKYNCTKDVENVNSKTPLITAGIKELLKLQINETSKEGKSIAPVTGSTGNFVTMNWYSGKADMEKYYLSEMLCGNDTCPLSRALKDSELGDEVSISNFGQFSEEFFTAGLWGVKTGNEDKVYALIEKTIQEIYEKGFTQDEIDAAVMGIDFNLREINRYWGPQSIQIMEQALKGWCRGDPCGKQLTPITSFEKVKAAIKEDKDYTKKLVKKYLIDNKTVIKFVVEPSEKYFENRNQAEAELIAKLEKTVNKEKLKKDLDELHAYQQKIETPEETACIPHTKIAELVNDIEIPEVDLQFTEGADGSQVPVVLNEQETNGIFYMNVLFPFDNLEPKYYQHIPFLTNILTNLGWNGKSWDDCVAESARIMGNVWGRTSTGTVPQVPECLAFEEKYKDYNFIGRYWLGFSCQALTEKVEPTLKMMAEIISKSDFTDEKRFTAIAQEMKAGKAASLVQSGMDYSLNRAKATVSAHQALMEIMYGASQLYTIQDYTKEKAGEILAMYKYMYYECLKSGGIINIVADKDSLNKIKPLLKDFAKEAGITKLLPGKKHTLEEYLPFIKNAENVTGNNTLEAIPVDSQTGYACVVTPCSEYLSKESIAEMVYCSWLNKHSLWDKLRTTGGAYGAGCWIDSPEKKMMMYTYRDPSPEKSVDTYINILDEISKAEIPAEDIEKTIVSEYGNAITPQSPKEKGRVYFDSLLYANFGFKHKRVDMLLNVSEKDVKIASQRISSLNKDFCHKEIFCSKKTNLSTSKILELPL